MEDEGGEAGREREEGGEDWREGEWGGKRTRRDVRCREGGCEEERANRLMVSLCVSSRARASSLRGGGSPAAQLIPTTRLAACNAAAVSCGTHRPTPAGPSSCLPLSSLIASSTLLAPSSNKSVNESALLPQQGSRSFTASND